MQLDSKKEYKTSNNDNSKKQKLNRKEQQQLNHEQHWKATRRHQQHELN